MAVRLTDNSIQVKARMTQAAMQALNEAGFEVAAHANRHVKLDGEAGQALRGSYRHVVDEGAGEVLVGTDREEGYWEEFGTGSYADTAKNGGKPGRPMWWVWAPGWEPSTRPRYTEEQAKTIAADLQRVGVDAHASNGRPPAYTLENAFTQTKPAVIAEFERLVREGLA